MTKTTKQNLNIKPLGDRVLVKPIAQEIKTKSGIIIPDTIDKEKPDQGEVVAVGEGRYEDFKIIPPRVKVGDRVLFSKYSPDEIKVEGEEYYILREENILAIIK
jgi:chaperonin GroES